MLFWRILRMRREEKRGATDRKRFYDALYGAIAKSGHRPQTDPIETQAS